MSGGPLIDLSQLGALTEPATKLIEAVSAAVGVLYEPRRMKRRAKAEVAVKLIHAEGEAELADRAARRIADRELRRQRNIETIVRSAIAELPEQVSEEPVDEDWISQFFGFCEDVSNPTMQSLWSRLLAGEVASPSSFSRRTLSIVQSMRQADAELFTRVCGFAVDFRAYHAVPALTEAQNYLKTAGLPFPRFTHLDDIGLVNTNAGTISLERGARMAFLYHGRRFAFSIPEKSFEEKFFLAPTLPIWMMTQAGRELLPLAGGEPDAEFAQLLGGWIEANRFDCEIDVPEEE